MANKKRQSGITAQMVREARGDRTQAACAELIGVTPRQIWQYERGACDIKVKSYELLLGIDDIPCANGLSLDDVTNGRNFNFISIESLTNGKVEK